MVKFKVYGQTEVVRDPFAVLPLGSNNYFAVCSINMHDIYLNTQLITIFIDISIVKIDQGIDM